MSSPQQNSVLPSSSSANASHLVTTAPVTKGSASSIIVLTMAVNVDNLIWLNTLSGVASNLPIYLLDSLPKATSTEIMDTNTIISSLYYSLISIMSSTFTYGLLQLVTFLGIHQNNIVFRFIMMLWVVTFLFGFCFLFTACFLMSIAAAA